MEEEKRRSSKAVPASSSIRFGPYELDLRSAELRKNEITIRLQDQPFQILVALLERPGEVVLRKEIRNKLWPDDTVVEFDHGINAAVKRLRDALCESVEKPRYIETLARKGYRFIGNVEALASQSEVLDAPIEPIAVPTAAEATEPVRPLLEEPPETVEHALSPRSGAQPRRINWWTVASGLAFVVLAGIAITLQMHPRAKSTPEMTRLTFDSGLTTDPAVSPDGKLLAYATDRNGSGRLHIWVQQFISDGQAVQLTNGDADEHQPAFSPDGSRIAFRSEREGGGVYVIPAIGGESTFIARGGRDPRFSPDGRWIAYWQATNMKAPWVAGAGTVYLVSSAGGPPHALRSNLTQAGVPEWSDDSRRLIVFGWKVFAPPSGDLDWWVMPVEGGPAIATGALPLLEQRGFSPGPDVPRVAGWHGDELLFVARHGDTTNVWKIPYYRSHPESDG